MKSRGKIEEQDRKISRNIIEFFPPTVSMPSERPVSV